MHDKRTGFDWTGMVPFSMSDPERRHFLLLIICATSDGFLPAEEDGTHSPVCNAWRLPPPWHTSILWLNGATLWLRLTLRGALHPCLLCSGQGDGLHHPHPLFAGVHKDLVHIAKLYPVHTQVTALHSKLGVMGLVREKKARSLVDGPPHVAQANLNHMERGAWGAFCKH